MQRYARQLRHQPVCDLRGQAARPEVVNPLLAPAADNVVPFTQLREELGNLFGLVLEIAIHRDDDVPRGRVEAGGERSRLTIVSRERDQSHS